MVAVSVWALLASRRFERVGYSALAGVLCALGMLTKQTFVLFVGGLIVVMFLRGGWRNWKGLAAFLAVGLALGLPWYVDHFSQLSGLASGYTTPGASGAAPANSIAPSRFSSANIAWYLWDLLNRVLLTPLTLLFLTGTVLALWRFCRRRAPDDLTPELLGGGLVALRRHHLTSPSRTRATHCPRWSTWRCSAPAGSRTPGAAAAALADRRVRRRRRDQLRRHQLRRDSIALAETAGSIRSPTLSDAGTLTFFSPMGWRAGPPVRDGDLLGLFRGLKRMGVQLIEVDGGSVNRVDFNNLGLVVLAEIAGMRGTGRGQPPGDGAHRRVRARRRCPTPAVLRRARRSRRHRRVRLAGQPADVPAGRDHLRLPRVATSLLPRREAPRRARDARFAAHLPDLDARRDATPGGDDRRVRRIHADAHALLRPRRAREPRRERRPAACRGAYNPASAGAPPGVPHARAVGAAEDRAGSVRAAARRQRPLHRARQPASISLTPEHSTYLLPAAPAPALRFAKW